MRKQYLEAGRITGTQGLRGEVRVESWCDSAEALCRLKRLYWRAGEEEVRVTSARTQKMTAILKLEGVDSIEAADVLRNKILYVNRDDIKLPKGSHFIQDILGLQAKDANTGDSYGTVTDVFKTGANDVYEITGGDGGKYLIPVIPDVIIQIDLKQDILLIRPMEGIFDHED